MNKYIRNQRDYIKIDRKALEIEKLKEFKSEKNKGRGSQRQQSSGQDSCLPSN